MRLSFTLIIYFCLFLSLCIFFSLPYFLVCFHQSYQSRSSNFHIYQLIYLDGDHPILKRVCFYYLFQNHSLQIIVYQSNSAFLLNSSYTDSSHLDSSVHPKPVNNSSKEEIDYHSSHNENKPQGIHPHSISHSSDVTFASQLSYVSLFHYNFSIIFLSRTSRLFYFKYLLEKWKGYLSLTIPIIQTVFSYHSLL